MVTFIQDKCSTVVAAGRRDLEFIGVARVVRFKGKAALILQIKDDVYSSSAALQMNRFKLSSERCKEVIL